MQIEFNSLQLCCNLLANKSASLLETSANQNKTINLSDVKTITTAMQTLCSLITALEESPEVREKDGRIWSPEKISLLDKWGKDLSKIQNTFSRVIQDNAGEIFTENEEQGLFPIIKALFSEFDTSKECSYLYSPLMDITLLQCEFLSDEKANIKEDFLLEISKLASEHIKNADQKKDFLINLAKEISKVDPEIGEYIHIFDIDPHKEEGQQVLIEIAKNAARGGVRCARSIQKFGIDPLSEQGKQALEEICAIALFQSHGNAASYLNNFGIDTHTEKGLQSIVKILTGPLDVGQGFIQHLKEFDIDARSRPGQLALIEIVKHVAKTHGKLLIENLEKFGIDAKTTPGKKTLIEILKIVAESQPSMTIRNVQKFNIDLLKEEDPEILITVAKIIAKNDGWAIADHIEDLGIDSKSEKGQDLLIELAQLAARQNASMVASKIKNFKIETRSQKGRVAMIGIAKVIAKESGKALAEYFKDFDLNFTRKQDRPILRELVEVAAESDPVGTFEYLHNFKLDVDVEEEFDLLVEVIKKAAEQNPAFVARRATELGFDTTTRDSKAALKEIREIIFQKDPKILIAYISDFAIESPNEQFLIFVEAVYQDLEALRYWENCQLSKVNKSYEPFVKIFSILSSEEPFTRDKISECLKELKTTCQQENLKIDVLTDHILAIKAKDHEQELMKQKNALTWLSITLGKLLYGTTQEIQYDKAVVLKVLTEILQMKAPALRRICSNFLLDVTSNPDAAKIYNDLNLKTNVKHTLLPNLMLTVFNTLGVSKPTLENCAEMIKSQKHENSNQPLFREADYYKLLLETLNHLIIENALNPQEKEFFLQQMFQLKNEKDLKIALMSIRGICKLKEGSTLKNEVNKLQDLSNSSTLTSASFAQILDQAFARSVQLKLPIDSKSIKNFATKWEDFTNSLRDPNAIFGYVAGALSLPSEEEKQNTLSVFNTFLTDVLEGNFKTNRYQGSIHLDYLQDYFKDTDIWENVWQKGESIPLSSLMQSEDIKEEPKKMQPLNFEEKIKQMFDGQHLKKEEFSILSNYLQDPSDDTFKKCFAELTEAKKTVEKGVKLAEKNHEESVSEIKTKKKQLLQEKKLLQLIHPAKNVNPRKILHNLIDLTKEKSDYKNDLQSLLKEVEDSTSGSTSIDEEFFVEEGDAYNDILQSGNEVEGSCLDVYHDPINNKCLNACLVDGKIRLIAIKDKASGRIKGRAFIRLMLDAKKQPVLFLEKIYPANLDAKFCEAIKKMALRKSKALGVPLLCKHKPGGTLYHSHIESLDSKAHYEYVDALSKICPKGRFVIKEADVMS